MEGPTLAISLVLHVGSMEFRPDTKMLRPSHGSIKAPAAVGRRIMFVAIHLQPTTCTGNGFKTLVGVFDLIRCWFGRLHIAVGNKELEVRRIGSDERLLGAHAPLVYGTHTSFPVLLYIDCMHTLLYVGRVQGLLRQEVADMQRTKSHDFSFFAYASRVESSRLFRMN